MNCNELCSTQDRVEDILKKAPETRSNDRLLIEMYLVMFHNIISFKQYRDSDPKKVPPFETITRLRRKIQSQGKYRAEEVVADARYENEAVYADYFGNQL